MKTDLCIARACEPDHPSLRTIFGCGSRLVYRFGVPGPLQIRAGAPVMNKKYQIFVSSTFSDLRDERKDAVEAILDLGQIPSGMELFPAFDSEQFDYIKQVIDECDYYVLIIGARYGSVNNDGISYTELEYDYATKSGKFVLAFVHDKPEEIPAKNVDSKEDTIEKLKSFKSKVMSGRLVKFWNTRDGLKSAVVLSLSRAFREAPQVGWVRGDAIASSELIEKNNNLLSRVSQLQEETNKIKRSQEVNIDNIADFEDKFVIRYESRLSANHSYMPAQIEVSWREIFFAVAANCSAPVVPSVIKSSIIPIIKSHTSRSIGSVNITDLSTIKAHLLAMKLIQSTSAKSVQGGVLEYISLTDLGRRKFVEIGAVRRVPDGSNSPET